MGSDEGGEIAHLVEDVVGAGLAQAVGGHQFGEAEDAHAGGDGAGDAEVPIGAR